MELVNGQRAAGPQPAPVRTDPKAA
jgi:hypothetical protein